MASLWAITVIKMIIEVAVYMIPDSTMTRTTKLTKEFEVIAPPT